MKDMKFSVAKGYEEDKNSKEHDDFGTTYWLEKRYDLFYSLPRDAEQAGYFPSIELWEKQTPFVKEDLPIFIAVLNTAVLSQCVSLYDVIDLFEFVQKYLPLCQREEHWHFSQKTERDFNSMMINQKKIMGDLNS
jgi:hypothetical protein